jgi:tripartite-type tricarboxylate transporter receptor subunit TctC
MRQKMFWKYPAVAFLFMFSLDVFVGIQETYAQQAEKYPSRPIEFVVPWGPGGGADQLARKTASLLEPIVGVSMPVVNMPGANGQTGLMKLLTQPADGYQIQVMTADTLVLFGTGNSKIQTSEFLPVAIMIQQPSGFYVKQDAPWKTWAELEKAAKTKTLKVGITGFDSPEDITVNYFASKGLKLISVPYAKPGERYAAALGGHIDILYEQAGDIRNFVDTKQLRPIIFFAEKRFSEFPNIPVSKELGYDVTLPQFRAIVIKAGTDQNRLKFISEALGKVAAGPGFKEYLKEQYAEEHSYVSLRDAQKYVDAWMADVKRVIDASGK